MKTWQFTKEFQHQLKRDVDHPKTWHLLLKQIEGDFKPLPTPDNKPDKKEFSWDSFFEKEQPIEIEIGSGKGGFMIAYAQKCPDINIIGSEIDTKVGKYAGSRIARNNIENATMVRGDLLLFLRDYAPSQSVNAFHMYFPDPWPKKKQRKNRLMREELLLEMQRCIKAGGGLFHWGTDFQEYHESTTELLQETEGFSLVATDVEATAGIQTNFEKKFIEEGRPIYRSIWKITP